ncbi:MAG: dienelactone hydrolase family protein [Planctomycetaceae bacterium]|nr:dienelactone hydrolase family protein [Planctomycetaceae bacterium]
MSILNSRCICAALLSLVAGMTLAADPTAEQRQFQDFVRAEARRINAEQHAPKTAAEWQARREEIHAALERAWGGFPDEGCPLEPRKLGEEPRDGYRFEKWVFQTLPGVWMTAFAYVPAGAGPFPAILQVHGHWKGAKQDPVVQSRCIGAAKLGFFVLAVDAFGAGERGLGEQLGEYHGEMVGTTLFPIGRPLSGIQVYENMRAVEYLQSRPEVDGSKIGITGASGGGNQTMYAGAFDDRFGAVVPCCSVGTYDSYLTTASCMCEVVPTGLAITEEWGVLSSVAPRGLMIISATKDAFQFSVGEAQKSLAEVGPVYEVTGHPERLKHAIFDWHHDYSQPMREAMYGWMTFNLKGQGDGSPIAELPLDVQEPERIRCFPDGSRPDDWLTLPQFAAREGRALLANWKTPAFKYEWSARADELRRSLEATLGGFPQTSPLDIQLVPNVAVDPSRSVWTFSPEPGLTLRANCELAKAATTRTAVLLNLEGAVAAQTSPLAAELRDAGWNLVTLDLRATGQLAWPGDAIMRASDHNSAQWAMWIGRPLIGQWTNDVHRLLQSMKEAVGDVGPVTVIGQGPAGLVALCAGATDAANRIEQVAAVGTLASYVSDVPYENQRVGIMAPGILRDVGDVQHIAALSFPRKVVVAGGVAGGGAVLTIADLAAAYSVAGIIARQQECPEALAIQESTSEITALLD